ncbi:MAG: methylenetetrahydrofolate--tRNA-(uracil(54)-C(5))-methyltransferase (FADH(2)-oxidizing) TrmFO [Clostridia bacterium]|nr:methylenetetrahydrofolate--tRNA-(uracil(54)-C(5))-methyltransferase (FADH(2)-oxidizing) TrmFO [Clostridia bacterium]
MNELPENKSHIRIIGAGLAGCEAAWQAARCGVSVSLYEMKPKKRTPAHHQDGYAELVCSNSLRSNEIYNAVGLLKEELRMLDSIVMEAAYQSRVPAGSALAVDRDRFSAYITEKIKSHPLITVYEGEEISSLCGDEITVVATGPLTSPALSKEIAGLIGDKSLYFYDAAAPIVDAESINYDTAFFASRYGKGEATDYLNCPFTKEEYDAFYQALITAETAEMHEFEKDLTVFEGCMPVEVMAKRGYQTLLFGPMKPVGLPLPSTEKEAYAIVQLRRENNQGSMYNLVGFQTHLTFPEQRRVFRMIPGLENAEFHRYGVMHRNTYINSPGVLSSDYSLISAPHIFFAGQMTGVEGYVESASSGLVAGINAARRAKGEEPYIFTSETMIGALANHVGFGNSANFQPMNANFGIVAPLEKRVKGGKKARNDAYAVRAISHISYIKDRLFSSAE